MKLKNEIVQMYGFDGVLEDEQGNLHHVHRTWCERCGTLTSETHMNCCGFTSNGWMKQCNCYEENQNVSTMRSE